MEIQLATDTVWKIEYRDENFDTILYAKKNNIKDVQEVKVRKLNIDAAKLYGGASHKKIELALSKANILIHGYKSQLDSNGNVILFGEGISVWRNPERKRRTTKNR